MKLANSFLLIIRMVQHKKLLRQEISLKNLVWITLANKDLRVEFNNQTHVIIPVVLNHYLNFPHSIYLNQINLMVMLNYLVLYKNLFIIIT